MSTVIPIILKHNSKYQTDNNCRQIVTTLGDFKTCGGRYNYNSSMFYPRWSKATSVSVILLSSHQVRVRQQRPYLQQRV